MTGTTEAGQSNETIDVMGNTRHMVARILYQAHYDLFHYLSIYNRRKKVIKRDGFRMVRGSIYEGATGRKLTALNTKTTCAFSLTEWGVIKSAFGFIFDDSYQLRIGGTPADLLSEVASIGYVRRKTLAEAKRTLTGPARQLFINAYLEVAPWGTE